MGLIRFSKLDFQVMICFSGYVTWISGFSFVL